MADSKITALTSISTSTDPANDPLVIVDVSDTSMAATGTTKKVTLNNLLACSPTATLASATITGDLTVATDRLKVVTASTAIQTGATTQLQVGTTSWPSTVIGKSGSRSLFGNAGEVIIWNESAAAIGNYSTLFVAAKTGAGATTMGGLQIRAGIENASNSDGFVSLWTSNNTAGGFVERYKIDSTGVATWSNVGGGSGTAMTLNSTGLGIGTSSPAAALDLTNTGITASREIRIENSAVRTFLGVEGSSGRFVGSAANNAYFGCSGAFGLEFATNNNVRMVVDSSGNVGISSGNLVMSTSGKGVDFSAVTGGTGTPTANVLNDYEEGTFTPTIVGTTGAGTGTYTTQLGRYTKVGRIVTCDISLVWTAHTGTGNIDIGGLPFSVLNTTGYAASAVIGYIDNIALTAGNIPIAVLWWFNTTKIRLNQTPTGGGAAAGVPMDSAGQINLSITYIVA